MPSTRRYTLPIFFKIFILKLEGHYHGRKEDLFPRCKTLGNKFGLSVWYLKRNGCLLIEHHSNAHNKSHIGETLFETSNLCQTKRIHFLGFTQPKGCVLQGNWSFKGSVYGSLQTTILYYIHQTCLETKT